MRLVCRIGFFIALVAVIAGSLVPNPWLSGHVPQNDKFTHMAGYFALAMLAAMGWPRFRGLALVGLPLLGLALEAAQTLTPTRGFSWLDAGANAVGIGLAVAMSALLTRWITREQKPR